MGCGVDSVMVIHGGGLYGNKEKAKARWCENYLKLPKIITDRLVCLKIASAVLVFKIADISEKVHVPVFDTHHFDCYNILHPLKNLISPQKNISHIFLLR